MLHARSRISFSVFEVGGQKTQVSTTILIQTLENLERVAIDIFKCRTRPILSARILPGEAINASGAYQYRPVLIGNAFMFLLGKLLEVQMDRTATTFGQIMGVENANTNH